MNRKFSRVRARRSGVRKVGVAPTKIKARHRIDAPYSFTPSCPPDGYVRIADGKVKCDDLVWNSALLKWEHPNSFDCEALGADVIAYFGVARRAV